MLNRSQWRRFGVVMFLGIVAGGLLDYRMTSVLLRQDSVNKIADLLWPLPPVHSKPDPLWLQKLAEVPLVAPRQSSIPPLVIHRRRVEVEEANLCRQLECYDI